MSLPNWLDTRDDVTYDEFMMVNEAEVQAENEQAHWEEERDYLALYFDMGDDDR